MSRFLALCALTVALSHLTAPALAGGSPRAHDGGFMLRMTGGFGGGSTSISNSTNELKFEGGQGEFTLAIGGVVRENLALHGTLFSFVMVDPDIRIDGGPAIPGSGNVSMNGVGAGLTWWAMPANFYVSGSAGIGRLTADPDNAGSSSSDRGFAMELALGKEWFMSDRWGLGLGGGLSWHTIPDGLIDENWSGTSISVRFSATFN